MELVVKSRTGKVSPRQRDYIEEKFTKLERFSDKISKVTVEFAEEQRRNEGVVHRAQVTLVGEHGVLLRAEQRAAEWSAAIDSAQIAVQRQITRYKDRHWRRGKIRRENNEIVGANIDLPAPTNIEDAETPAPKILRTKEFQVKPMHSDEAVEQMELLGHSFFVFCDADTDMINVLYRRDDGNYGLIVPTDGEE